MTKRKTPTGRVPSQPEMQRLPSRLHRIGERPAPLAEVDYSALERRVLAIGLDLSSKPDMTATAIVSAAGCIRVVHGRRAAHEALCVPLVRARRMAEGRPPAQWVVVCWRQKQRILRHAKQLALSSKLRLHRPFGGEPSAS